MFIGLVFSHFMMRYWNDRSKTHFKASNFSINSEGIYLDFKVNNHLKATKVNKFGETHYWGNYEEEGDMLHLYIETDFALVTDAYIVKENFQARREELHFV